MPLIDEKTDKCIARASSRSARNQRWTELEVWNRPKAADGKHYVARRVGRSTRDGERDLVAEEAFFGLHNALAFFGDSTTLTDTVRALAQDWADHFNPDGSPISAAQGDYAAGHPVLPTDLVAAKSTGVTCSTVLLRKQALAVAVAADLAELNEQSNVLLSKSLVSEPLSFTETREILTEALNLIGKTVRIARRAADHAVMILNDEVGVGHG